MPAQYEVVVVVGQHGSRRDGASQKRRLSWSCGWAERRYPAARRLEGHGCLIGTDNSSAWLIRDVGAPWTHTVVGWKRRGALHPELISPQTHTAVIVTQQSGQLHPQPRQPQISLDSTPGLNRKRAWSVRNSNLPKPTHTHSPRITPNTQTSTQTTDRFSLSVRPICTCFCMRVWIL